MRTVSGDENLVIDASLGASQRRIDAVFALDQVTVKSVFDVGLTARRVVEALGVALVIGEERTATRRGVEIALAQAIRVKQIRERRGLGVVGEEEDFVEAGGSHADLRFLQGGLVPGPRIAKP